LTFPFAGSLVELTKHIREFCVHLVRHADYPVTAADALGLMSRWTSLIGPFDWSLALGTCDGSSLDFTRPPALGGLIAAWYSGDARAKDVLAHYLSLLLSRLSQETTIHVMADLPRGFNSDAPLALSSLLRQEGFWPRACQSDLWRCTRAMSYASLDLQSGTDDELLDVRVPVVGKRVLLMDGMNDRPHLASQCAHVLKSRGAEWVGYLTLLTTEDTT
jgi:hypothetical protein